MPRIDFSSPRLYVDAALSPEARIDLNSAQANYLRNVMRLRDGGAILVFNGRDGEWRATLDVANRKSLTLTARERIRPQDPPFDLHYLFAPLKHARLDYMAQKAVEMGAGQLRPVLTRRTQAERINLDRMRANVIEAAEQCGILSIPEVLPAIRLDALLQSWNPDRLFILCDEDAPVRDPIEALREGAAQSTRPVSVLIGPEGGFEEEERRLLLALPHSLRLSLGPRILRADTAAVAALALIQSVLGDWRSLR